LGPFLFEEPVDIFILPSLRANGGSELKFESPIGIGYLSFDIRLSNSFLLSFSLPSVRGLKSAYGSPSEGILFLNLLLLA